MGMTYAPSTSFGMPVTSTQVRGMVAVLKWNQAPENGVLELPQSPGTGILYEHPTETEVAFFWTAVFIR